MIHSYIYSPEEYLCLEGREREKRKEGGGENVRGEAIAK